MKKKVILLLGILTVIGIITYLALNIPAKPATTPHTPQIDSYIRDDGNIQLYFCPRDNCEQRLVDFIDSANSSIHCALFEIDLQSVKDKLLEKSKEIEVEIVTDDQYLKQFKYSFVKADASGLMHNKFCVIDGIRVSTGSMNPTNNDAHKNNNNLLLINSRVLAINYEDEFQEMWNGTFKKGRKVLNPKIMLRDIHQSGLYSLNKALPQKDIFLENYFSPDDNCAVHVKEELKKAHNSIYFMAFSFTHEGIGNILLLKKLDNLTVTGIMEARQVTKYSQFKRLVYNRIEVKKDANPGMMHHKVFIIDNETIVTGSFNPTAGGDSRNDENILIIHDKEIARRFMEEFEIIYNIAINSTN